jgi:hypothetical protein
MSARKPKPRATRLGRFVRRWRFDRNPLRRATDRAETAVLAVLVAAFLVGAPFAALATGAWVHGMARQAQLAQEASRRQVTAIVLAVTAPPAGEQLGWQARARWRAPNGHTVTHEVPVPSDMAAGGKLQVWTDLTGDFATAPLLDSQVAGQTLSGEALGVIASAGVLTVAGALALWTLNKRRMAAWDADWRACCVPPAAGKLLLRRARRGARRYGTILTHDVSRAELARDQTFGPSPGVVTRGNADAPGSRFDLTQSTGVRLDGPRNATGNSPTRATGWRPLMVLSQAVKEDRRSQR